MASNGLSPNPDPSGEHPDGDPHMWMNPLNVVHYVENIRDGLTQADPAGKDIYSCKRAKPILPNSRTLINGSKARWPQLPPEKRLLVTNHDALGYFSEAYGFKVVGAVIPSVTDEASPRRSRLAGLIDTIKSSGAPAIFLDIGENQNLAQPDRLGERRKGRHRSIC